jgi:DNA mismatch endonuclease (patch repair protein)
MESSSEAASKRMRANRRRDTGPELRVRKELYRRGLRFRVDLPLLQTRRRADVAFPRARIAVFLDGCYWHGCPLQGTSAAANADFGRQKIGTNQARDRDTDALLAAAGWTSLRFWEHEDSIEVANATETQVRGCAVTPRA